MTEEEKVLLREIETLRQELLAKMNRYGDIITYSEFREQIEGIIYDFDSATTLVEKLTLEKAKLTEDIAADFWFHKYQKKALNLIRKKLAQSHLIPRNRRDFLDLKEDLWVEKGTNIYHSEAYNYKELFANALAEQINFMHNEETTYDNGWLNSTNSLNIGGYSQSQTPDRVVNKLFKDLYPTTYDDFETMGWTYASLSHPLDWEDFYKGEM